MKRLLPTAFAVALIGSVIGSVGARAEGDPHACGMTTCTQDLTPPKQIEMYLDGYHIAKKDYNLPGEKQVQFRAAHYCSHLPSGVFMCSVYDGNGPHAKLVAIEYVISDDKYKTLSEKEKKMWHPHDAEVDTGMLRMPGLDPEKEKSTLAFLRGTHGKTWQLWPDPKMDLPIGEPVLLWSIEPNKINETTKKSMEQRKVDPKY